MKLKRQSIARVALVSVCAVAFVTMSLGVQSSTTLPVEPTYEGRTLSSWLNDLSITPAGPEFGPAANAIRQMVTNALPGLLRRIEAGTTATNDQPNLAVNAIRELGDVARPAVPRLSELVHKEQSAPCAAAALVILRSEAPVIDALTNRSRTIQRGALIALAEDTVGEAAVPPLISFLKDSDSETRHLAAWALGRIHKGGSIAIPALTAALADDVAWVRKNALEAICEFKLPAKIKVTALLKTLADPDAFVRGTAIARLGEICRFYSDDDNPVVSALIDALKDRNDDVRIHTVRALGRIMNGRLGGEHPRDRQSVKAPGEFESQAKLLVPALIRALSDASAGVREQAVDALGEIGKVNEEQDARIAAALARALEDKSERVRSRAERALENFRRGAKMN